MLPSVDNDSFNGESTVQAGERTSRYNLGSRGLPEVEPKRGEPSTSGIAEGASVDLLHRANVLRNYKLTWQPDASADLGMRETNAPFGKVIDIGSVDPIEGFGIATDRAVRMIVGVDEHDVWLTHARLQL
jgi:hypothetical protein